MAAAQLLTLSLAVTLTLMTLSTRSTDAIQCYSCNSIVNSLCFDPFKNSSANSLDTCQSAKSCVKERAVINSK